MSPTDTTRPRLLIPSLALAAVGVVALLFISGGSPPDDDAAEPSTASPSQRAQQVGPRSHDPPTAHPQGEG